MTRNNLVTALGFIVLGFIALTLQLTPAQAFHLLGSDYSHVRGGPVWKVAIDCPLGGEWSEELGRCPDLPRRPGGGLIWGDWPSKEQLDCRASRRIWDRQQGHASPSRSRT